MKRTPLRKVSKRRMEERKIYLKMRTEFLGENPVCQICETRRAQDVHHVFGRHNGNMLKAETFMAVCRLCHDKVHREPKWAEANGYLSVKR